MCDKSYIFQINEMFRPIGENFIKVKENHDPWGELTKNGSQQLINIGKIIV